MKFSILTNKIEIRQEIKISRSRLRPREGVDNAFGQQATRLSPTLCSRKRSRFVKSRKASRRGRVSRRFLECLRAEAGTARKGR